MQRDIREGHAITVDKVLAWLQPDARAGTSICDAGCGTGSLAIPLALKGAAVTATDISAAMAGEAEKRYKDAISSPGAPPRRPSPRPSRPSASRTSRASTTSSAASTC